jgi:hypothetical protein
VISASRRLPRPRARRKTGTGGWPRASRDVLLSSPSVVGVGVAAYKSYAVLKVSIPPTDVADYRRIGELTGHTTRATVADDELRTPAMYWGWIGAQSWDLGDDYPPPSVRPEAANASWLSP